MSNVDWIVATGVLAFIIGDGVRKARGNRTASDFLLASRAAPWWAVGLSVMATQASAVTLVGTTGLGFREGTGFAQFYYFLPVAMGILCFTAVPFFHRERVFTAYEFLERRFDRTTRTAASATFLVIRCLSLGVVLSAAAFVLGEFLDRPYAEMVALMAAVAILYTSMGGLKAVISTDVKQMALMVIATLTLFLVAVRHLPNDVGLEGAIRLADAAGRLELADWSLDPSKKYTIWSALLGGTIVFLAYFGTDQSQVQRYLAGRSLSHQRGALLLNAVCKVPFQLLILLLGVILFMWSLYEPIPVVLHSATGEAATHLDGHDALDQAFGESQSRAGASGRRYLRSGSEADRDVFQADIKRLDEIRRSARQLRTDGGLSPKSETNYVVPWFMKNRLSGFGLVGLLLAGILAAALSSIDSELNSLATVGSLDILRLKPGHDDHKIIWTSRAFTVVFGVLAAIFAFSLENAGALVETVNMVGSWFYGALLGLFLLAWFDSRAHGRGAIAGLLSGIVAVWLLFPGDEGAWLYRNTVGTLTTVTVGAALSRLLPPRRTDYA